MQRDLSNESWKCAFRKVVEQVALREKLQIILCHFLGPSKPQDFESTLINNSASVTLTWLPPRFGNYTGFGFSCAESSPCINYTVERNILTTTVDIPDEGLWELQIFAINHTIRGEKSRPLYIRSISMYL